MYWPPAIKLGAVLGDAAIACKFIVLVTAMGELYMAEAVVGMEPSVV